MIELGKMQSLEVVRISKIGLYLNSKGTKAVADILLPNKDVPKSAKVGDEIRVFVYKDSEDRIISTTKKPKIVLGEMAPLKVVQTSNIGAFMDWGLEKDLFLPFKRQTEPVKKDGTYLVGLEVDRSDRLCATMDVFNMLSTESTFKMNDTVKCTIYNINEDYGIFVAVSNKFNGLIPKKEVHGIYKYGDEVEARITKVRPDGRLELSLRKEAYNEMAGDAEKILRKMKANGGKLMLNDNSNPNDIKIQLNLSKASFKRAVGRLLKERKIKITPKGIELI